MATKSALSNMTPLHYLVVLFPGFQLLDVGGPLDILNLASLNITPAKKVELTLAAEFSGPVPTKPPGLADQGMNITCSQSIIATDEFGALVEAVKRGEVRIDVLLIPGGFGTRLPSAEEPYSLPAQRFVTAIAPYVRMAIITVCTGSDILAQTGLLDGRRATTNKLRFTHVAGRNPGVQWLKTARWVKSVPEETQGGLPIEIWTSGGISAGMDVMLGFVAEYYGGLKVARNIAKVLEYDWRESGDGEEDSFYKTYFEEDK